jgi:hypothetical protein
VSEFNQERALARYIEFEEQRDAEFRRLPDYQRRVARGDYDFISSVDIELRELEQEAQRNGFVLEARWDGEHLVYACEPMSPEDHATFWAEEQEIVLEDLKWKHMQGYIDPWVSSIEIKPTSLILVESAAFRYGMNDGALWYFYGDALQSPVTEADVVDFLQGNVVELAQMGDLDENSLRANAGFLLGWIAAQFLPLPARAERTFF